MQRWCETGARAERFVDASCKRPQSPSPDPVTSRPVGHVPGAAFPQRAYARRRYNSRGPRFSALGPAIVAFLGLTVLLLLPIATAQAETGSMGGIAIVGADAKGRTVAQRLDALKLDWYYDYSYRLEDEAPGKHKVGVVRAGETNRTDPRLVAEQAAKRPGHYWLMFNEPDLEGQDKVSDQFLAARGQERFAYYAQIYHDYEVAIKTADPTAKLVGPNLFFYGDPSTRSWTDSFRAAYRAAYGREPVVDVWGMHLYYFDASWERLPQIDLEPVKTRFAAYMDYVHSIPGQERAPVWVTEMGSIWGFSDISQDPASGKFTGNRYAWKEIRDYLGALLPWLEQQGASRWFVFGSNPYADPWSLVPNAPYAIDEKGELTQMGALLVEFSSIGR